MKIIKEKMDLSNDTRANAKAKKILEIYAVGIKALLQTKLKKLYGTSIEIKDHTLYKTNTISFTTNKTLDKSEEAKRKIQSIIKTAYPYLEVKISDFADYYNVNRYAIDITIPNLGRNKTTGKQERTAKDNINQKDTERVFPQTDILLKDGKVIENHHIRVETNGDISIIPNSEEKAIKNKIVIKYENLDKIKKICDICSGETEITKQVKNVAKQVRLHGEFKKEYFDDDKNFNGEFNGAVFDY